MKTTKLQLEFIGDEFQDYIDVASEIIGCECCDTFMRGDPDKGDGEEVKYRILPEPYLAGLEDEINLKAFVNYFNGNFGKWDERVYFDTPAEAFAQLIKAWHIWTNSLETKKKQEYIALGKRFLSK